ncbi:HIT family protein [Rossellomorea aquimaris]|uniref:HIT family protein n=1 Tax=Rossellomorea aquimaris TaxID=189382 RepID=UPI0007D0A494|nr:HIT family protein [Rossellomorea aquimaris]
MSECLGCRLANKEEQVLIVYENDSVCCILDHAPYHSGHTLILPKKHKIEVVELGQEEYIAIMEASKLIAKAVNAVFQPDGITICQNGGVFNDLTHYHMHVVPRYEGENFGESFYDEVLAETRVAEESLVITQKKLKNYIDREIEKVR